MLEKYQYKFLDCVIQGLSIEMKELFNSSSMAWTNAIREYNRLHWGLSSYERYKFLPEYKKAIEIDIKAVPLFIAKFAANTRTQSESYMLMPIYERVINNEPRLSPGGIDSVTQNEFDRIAKAVYIWFEISFDGCLSFFDYKLVEGTHLGWLSESCCALLVGES
jgi:hypothetical protein